MASRRVLILGIGNLLVGDEGVGVHAAQSLAGQRLPPGVDVLDGGTGGLNLLAYFTEYPLIILIDATLDGRPPGTISVLQPKFPSEYPQSLGAHDIGLRDLITAAALLGPLPEVHLITISIERMEAGTLELSPPIQDSIDAVLAVVHAILRLEGFTRSSSRAHRMRLDVPSMG